MRVGHEIDVDRALGRVPRRDPVGPKLHRVETDGEDKIRRAHLLHVNPVDDRGEASAAEGEGMVLWNDPFRLVGRHDRNPPPLEKALELGAGMVQLHAHADERKRTARPLKPDAHLAPVRRRRCRANL